jgi:hypothetical protein
VTCFREGFGVVGTWPAGPGRRSLETAFDDGRFTGVVRELLVEYCDPLYRKSCLEGRRFVWELETSEEPLEDVRRFPRAMSPLIREVSS